ncbi:MAG: hypothetical protein J2P53_17925, partial [Bradyrhizobiaceae bacterium]|nr:hypothetical protein [Bradyrhizobiaceae bacterium]
MIVSSRTGPSRAPPEAKRFHLLAIPAACKKNGDRQSYAGWRLLSTFRKFSEPAGREFGPALVLCF